MSPLPSGGCLLFGECLIPCLDDLEFRGPSVGIEIRIQIALLHAPLCSFGCFGVRHIGKGRSIFRFRKTRRLPDQFCQLGLIFGDRRALGQKILQHQFRDDGVAAKDSSTRNSCCHKSPCGIGAVAARTGIIRDGVRDVRDDGQALVQAYGGIFISRRFFQFFAVQHHSVSRVFGLLIGQFQFQRSVPGIIFQPQRTGAIHIQICFLILGINIDAYIVCTGNMDGISQFPFDLDVRIFVAFEIHRNLKIALKTVYVLLAES